MQIIKNLFKRDDLRTALQNAEQQLNAQRDTLNKVMAIIEFTPDGVILDANEMFVLATGYSKSELIGHHHRMLVDTAYANSSEYAHFWKKLSSGEFDKGQYRRVSKSGEDIWLEASYNPVIGATGKVEKVIKYATVITNSKIQEFDRQGQLSAIDKVIGVIEFTLNGHILRVNDNFLNVTGYSREEIIGRHHRLFMHVNDGASPAYQAFWQKLGRGEYDSGIYKRIGKNGQEIWLQASYNPIFDNEGKPFKVVKYATDITAQKLKDADVAGQLKAINKIQAVIQFDLKGHILEANDNFVQAVGYAKEEIVGKHHSMFVLDDEKNSAAYAQFWHDLAHGRSKSGIFERVGKLGQTIWLQADYNPIYDAEGKPFKVVKYATDITAEHLKDIDNAGQVSAINRALATIEFTLDGHILKANQNFCAVVGYDLSEIIGQHHRMFVAEELKRSLEYQQFWQKLSRGEFVRGVFERVGKKGNNIWLQASYNPIIDEKGRVIKVVKYAIDITAQKLAENGLRLAVTEMQQLLEAAQQGDMTARIDLSDKTDQILSLSKGINALMEMLSGILLQVQAASQMIDTAANEISSGNSDLSMRTEKQAHNLQDTAASMSELASTVKQNADNAKQASEFAAAASKVAERGGLAVSEVVQTMGSINDSAKKIADITSVIDSIAFQTNILALNASVEAARAGDQGKGFAVVADEVRNLAQRSASAAKEIKVLIADSVNKVNEGSRLAEGAGNTMSEIVQSVKKVSDIIGEISIASAEQTTGIDQVNLAVGSMDDTTQQNAALVEQAAAAAESLVDQAGQLTEVVSGFKLSKSQVKEVKPFSFLSKNGTY